MNNGYLQDSFELVEHNTPAPPLNKSQFLPPSFENIPEELGAYPQWVAWKGVFNPEKGKSDKVPMNPRTGTGAISTVPATWGTFDEAKKFYLEWQGQEHSHLDSKKGMQTGPIAGIGFVFTAADPFVGIDLDHCIGEDGIIEPWAQEIIRTANSYTELSPSGTGVHIFVKGKKPGKACKKGNVEMYEFKRYLTMTGITVPAI